MHLVRGCSKEDVRVVLRDGSAGKIRDSNLFFLQLCY